jgi:DNA adenine methylase
MRNINKSRPFLKWAGNKCSIIEQIKQKLPQGSRLIEPFLGSGAVFLNTGYESYLLNDNNPDLITLYQLLQQQGQQFIDLAHDYFTAQFNNEKVYYQQRTQFNQSRDPLERSLIFLYLNRHGYNGLCRYNSSGQYNVPFGRYRQPYFPEQEMLYFQEKSQHVTFTCQDFRTCMQQAQPGDIIYCDPPYVSSTFTRYSQNEFNNNDQEQLQSLALQLAQQGISVLLSNHDTEFTRQLYQQAQLSFLKVNRHISRDVLGRTAAREVLALFSVPT